MCTVTLSYDKNDAAARQTLAALLSTGLFVLCDEERDMPMEMPGMVYVDNGKVVVNVTSESMTIDEAKALTLKAIDMEYSLP